MKRVILEIVSILILMLGSVYADNLSKDTIEGDVYQDINSKVDSTAGGVYSVGNDDEIPDSSSSSTSSAMAGYCEGEIPCSVFTSQIECEYAVDTVNKLEETDKLGTFLSRYGLCKWNENSQECVGKTSCMALNALLENPTDYDREGVEVLCNKYREDYNYNCEWKVMKAKTFYEKIMVFLKNLFSFIR